MNLQELGTIFQSRIPIKIILLNNNYLGMVRQWQELFFNKRYSFTEMINPDFGLIACGNDMGYECVENRTQLPAAIARMKKSTKAYLLEVKVEKEENGFSYEYRRCFCFGNTIGINLPDRPLKN